MNISANVIPLFVVIPFAGAFIASIAGRRFKWLSPLIGVLAALSLAVNSFLALQLVRQAGVIVYCVGAWKPPVGISMVLDGMSAFMLVTVNLVAFVISVYSLNYMERFTSKWKFYILFLLMLGGMNGVIVTGDIFNLYVFLEIASIASFILVAFGTEKEELEAAFKYAVMSTVGSMFVLLGIALLYGYTSTLNMADIASVLAQKGKGNLLLMVSVLFIMGFGLKSALVPFHAWLPDAHPSAPAPISAMLSGVLVKSLGIYTLARIFCNVIGMPPMVASILMFLATLSMVVGGLGAIGQKDFKRLLAYSTVSQVGYIILGLALGTPLGILGAMLHLFNHSVFKSLLFLNAGAVEYAAGTRDLEKLGGLSKNMPVTSFTNAIASMSISGIPPFNGFWSKLIVILAAVQAGKYWYAFWGIVASVLTLAAVLKAMRCVFWSAPKEEFKDVKEVPFAMKAAMLALAVVCVLGGLLLLPKIDALFLKQASGVLLQGTQYAVLVLRKI